MSSRNTFAVCGAPAFKLCVRVGARVTAPLAAAPVLNLCLYVKFLLLVCLYLLITWLMSNGLLFAVFL